MLPPFAIGNNLEWESRANANSNFNNQGQGSYHSNQGM